MSFYLNPTTAPPASPSFPLDFFCDKRKSRPFPPFSSPLLSSLLQPHHHHLFSPTIHPPNTLTMSFGKLYGFLVSLLQY